MQQTALKYVQEQDQRPTDFDLEANVKEEQLKVLVPRIQYAWKIFHKDSRLPLAASDSPYEVEFVPLLFHRIPKGGGSGCWYINQSAWSMEDLALVRSMSTPMCSAPPQHLLMSWGPCL